MGNSVIIAFSRGENSIHSFELSEGEEVLVNGDRRVSIDLYGVPLSPEYFQNAHSFRSEDSDSPSEVDFVLVESRLKREKNPDFSGLRGKHRTYRAVLHADWNRSVHRKEDVLSSGNGEEENHRVCLGASGHAIKRFYNRVGQSKGGAV